MTEKNNILIAQKNIFNFKVKLKDIKYKKN